MIEKEDNRIRHASDLLYQATKSIRILTHVGWAADVRDQFFKNGARELPSVSYPVFDDSETLEIIAEARQFIKDTEIDKWLDRQAGVVETSARMLSASGTPDFFKYSRPHK